MRILDMTSQILLCEQTNAQIESCFKQLSNCMQSRKRKCSNIDLLFLTEDKSFSSFSANVLRAADIAELLSQYLNQRFVDTLISIATHDVRIKYEESLSSRMCRSNHAFSYLHMDVIKNSIQFELEKSRIKQIQLSADYFYSFIELMSKLDDDT